MSSFSSFIAIRLFVPWLDVESDSRFFLRGRKAFCQGRKSVSKRDGASQTPRHVSIRAQVGKKNKPTSMLYVLTTVSRGMSGKGGDSMENL
jgi:hypothetical protein